MKRLLIPLKLMVTTGVFWWLLRDFDWQAFLATFQGVKWWYVVLAGLLSLGAQGFIAAFRWRMLAASLGLYAPFLRMQRHYLVGIFFSLFLPGVVGGDAVRAWLLNRELGGGQLVKAGYSVIADRGNGIFGMAFLAAPVGWLLLERIPLPWAMGMSTLTVGLCVAWLVAPFLLTWMHRWGNSWVDKFIPPMLLVFWRPEGRWWLGVVLSLLYVVVTGGVAWSVDLGMGLGLPYIFYLFLIPMMALIAAMPVSIGGHGVREGLFVLGLSWWGIPVEQGLAFSALMLMAFVVPCVIGGIIFFLTRGTVDSRQMAQEIEGAEQGQEEPVGEGVPVSRL